MRGSNIVAALAGAFVALLIVGGFLALDRTTLHWYAEEGAATGLTATAAEAYAISYVRDDTSAARWIEDGWQPNCEASDRSQGEWMVACGMTNMITGFALPQMITYLVGDDGTVASFPESSP